MTNFQAKVFIDRPVGEVFAFLMDPDNDPTWQSTILEVAVEPEGPIAVGTKYHQQRRFLGKRFPVTFEVTEHEPPKKSTIQITDGPFPGEAGYRLEGFQDGTELTVSADLEAAGFFKLAEPVFTRIFRREMASNLGILKELLEARADAVSR